MDKITVSCNAKINLALDVTGRRADGYHDVELIFKEIPLCDTVTVALTDDGEIRLCCDDPTLPSDEGNIAYRAAAEILKEAKSRLGAEITLGKKIPHGAGFAGGSADAAGVLKAINTLLGSPFSVEKLMELGTRLGADVPFCVLGGCAFAEGIGEILTPLPDFGGFTYVITKPRESVSTKLVYERLDLTARPEGLDVRAAADGIRRGDLAVAFKSCANIMESVTAAMFPDI